MATFLQKVQKKYRKTKRYCGRVLRRMAVVGPVIGASLFAVGALRTVKDYNENPTHSLGKSICVGRDQTVADVRNLFGIREIFSKNAAEVSVNDTIKTIQNKPLVLALPKDSAPLLPQLPVAEEDLSGTEKLSPKEVEQILEEAGLLDTPKKPQKVVKTTAARKYVPR